MRGEETPEIRMETPEDFQMNGKRNRQMKCLNGARVTLMGKMIVLVSGPCGPMDNRRRPEGDPNRGKRIR